MSTLTDLLRKRATSSEVGLLFEQQRYTWHEVVEAATARARYLVGQRLPGPAHVGVLLPNVPDAIFWLFAGHLAGTPIVGLNSTRRGAELAHDITHTDVRLIVTDRYGLALVDGAGVDVPVWCLDRPEDHAALDAAGGVELDEAVPDERCAVLIFTSGTTSAPKAAMRSHRALAGFGERLSAAWEVTADDVAYNCMPWFHSNALYHAVYPTLHTHGTLALRSRFSASGFVHDIRTFRATRFNYVGKVLEYVLATPPTPDDADNVLRLATGSEASDRDIAAFAARFGTRVIDGFGSTEAGVGILRTPDMPAGSLGRAADDNTVVMDPDTAFECPRARFDEGGRLLNAEEAIGEFVNKVGLAAFEGYYNNDDANAERSRNGWYWSGDLGYQDEQGFFYFAGRGYDWLRVDGENFSAAPVERIVLRHPSIRLAAAYAVPDPNTGDQLMLAVELVDGATFDPDEFTGFLDAQSDLGTKWRPRFVRVSASMPMSHTNKIRKAALRDEAWLATDPIWWRPGRERDYRRLTERDVVDLAERFAQAGRAAMAPRPEPGS